MKIKSRKLFKIIVLFICFFMFFEQSGFAQIAGQLDISGQIVAFRNSLVQDKFRPLHLRYLSYNPQDNNFQLRLDRGNEKKLSNKILEESSQTLLKYVFIGITLSNDSFWVNLRPDGEDSIIDPLLAQTDIGRIFLEADVQLKKDTARFTSPETAEGKAYWDKLYLRAEEIYGSQNITIPTLTRPWIVPNEIIVRETNDNAYIYKATLKVMLEQDYLKNSSVYNFQDTRQKELNDYSTQLLREKIIPKLTQEINTSKRYAALRQVYYSLILAQWFKQKFSGRGGAYSQLINRKNLNGLTSKESWSKTTYFHQYQKSFQQGEYSFKVPVATPFGQTIRSYFSGGVDLMKLSSAEQISSTRPLPGAIANNPNLLQIQVDGPAANLKVAFPAAPSAASTTPDQSVGSSHNWEVRITGLDFENKEENGPYRERLENILKNLTPEELCKILNNMYPERVFEPQVLLSQIDMQYHGKGSFKRVYKLIFHTKNNQELSVCLAFKAAAGIYPGGISQRELEYNKQLRAAGIRVPRFGKEFLDEQGETTAYMEEFIEGPTAEELFNTKDQLTGNSLLITEDRKAIIKIIIEAFVKTGVAPADINRDNFIKAGEWVLVDAGSERISDLERLLKSINIYYAYSGDNWIMGSNSFIYDAVLEGYEKAGRYAEGLRELNGVLPVYQQIANQSNGYFPLSQKNWINLSNELNQFLAKRKPSVPVATPEQIAQINKIYSYIKELVRAEEIASPYGSYISRAYSDAEVEDAEIYHRNPYFNPLTFARVFIDLVDGKLDSTAHRLVFEGVLDKMGQKEWIDVFWDVYLKALSNSHMKWRIRVTDTLNRRLGHLDSLFGVFQLDLSTVYNNIIEYLGENEPEKNASEIEDLKNAAKMVNKWIEEGVAIDKDPREFIRFIEKLHFIAAQSLAKDNPNILFDYAEKLSLPRSGYVTHSQRPRYFPSEENLRALMLLLASRVCSPEFKLQHPVLQAAELYLRLTDLQIFWDGNRRVAKLIMDYFLMRNHLPPLEINENNKQEFMKTIRFMQTPEELADFIVEELIEQRKNYVAAEASNLPVLKRAQLDKILVERKFAAPRTLQQVKDYFEQYLKVINLDYALVPEIVFVDTKGILGLDVPLFKAKLYTDDEQHTHLLIDRSAFNQDGTVDKKVITIDVLHEIIGHRLVRERFPQFERINYQARLTGEESTGVMYSKTLEEVLARISMLISFNKMLEKNPILLGDIAREYAQKIGVDILNMDVTAYARAVVKEILDSNDLSIYKYKKNLSNKTNAEKIINVAARMTEQLIQQLNSQRHRKEVIKNDLKKYLGKDWDSIDEEQRDKIVQRLYDAQNKAAGINIPEEVVINDIIPGRSSISGVVVGQLGMAGMQAAQGSDRISIQELEDFVVFNRDIVENIDFNRKLGKYVIKFVNSPEVVIENPTVDSIEKKIMDKRMELRVPVIDPDVISEVKTLRTGNTDVIKMITYDGRWHIFYKNGESEDIEIVKDEVVQELKDVVKRYRNRIEEVNKKAKEKTERDTKALVRIDNLIKANPEISRVVTYIVGDPEQPGKFIIGVKSSNDASYIRKIYDIGPDVSLEELSNRIKMVREVMAAETKFVEEAAQVWRAWNVGVGLEGALGVFQQDQKNEFIRFGDREALFEEHIKIMDRLRELKVNGVAIGRFINVLGLLIENIEQHVKGDGVLIVRIDEKHGEIYFSVMDKGNGFNVFDKSYLEVNSGGGVIQDPKSTGKGKAYARIFADSEEVVIYTQGRKFRKNKTIRGEDGKIWLLSVPGYSDVNGSLVCATIDLLRTSKLPPVVSSSPAVQPATPASAPTPTSGTAGKNTKGGIDFRGLPIVTQPMNITGVRPVIPQGYSFITNTKLDKEWSEIENMLNGGIIPSIERIREYLALSCQSQDCQARIDKALSCIADILRIEEERCFVTDSALKQVLILLESDKPANELQLALLKIGVLAKEPILIGQ